MEHNISYHRTDLAQRKPLNPLDVMIWEKREEEREKMRKAGEA